MPGKKMVIGLTPVGDLLFTSVFLLKKVPSFICCLLNIVLNICLLIGLLPSVNKRNHIQQLFNIKHSSLIKRSHSPLSITSFL